MMLLRIGVLPLVLALAALSACGSGEPGCDSAEVAAQVVANSAEAPWYSGGLLIVGVEDGREEGRQPPGEGANCAGVAVFEDGSRRPMDFRADYGDDGEFLVGFDYEGREDMAIPKSKWEGNSKLDLGAPPGKAIISDEIFDCDWLAGQWETARRELGDNIQTWEDYRPAASAVALAMQAEVPGGQYLAGDADTALRQCSLPGYPPWERVSNLDTGRRR